MKEDGFESDEEFTFQYGQIYYAQTTYITLWQEIIYIPIWLDLLFLDFIYEKEKI